MTAMLLVHAAATWAMVGVIWFVQVVHYPLFAAVGSQAFPSYEDAHRRLTTIVVAIFMPAELATGLALVVWRPAGVGALPVLVGAALLGALWLSTAAWQAPLHGRLTAGFDPTLHRRLVSSNWVRTVLWSLRGGLVLVMLAAA